MRRLRVWGLPAAVAALTVGCGVRPTDVVEVGDPATARVSPAGSGTVLYFIGPSSPRTVLPVVRGSRTSGGQGVDPPPDKALGMLTGGPTESEKAAGLWTELPTDMVMLGAAIDGPRVRVRLGTPVTGLSTLARLQLVCTAAHLSAPGTGGPRGSAQVTVQGTDGSIGPSACPL